MTAKTLRDKLQRDEKLRVLFLNDLGFLYGAGIAHRRQILSFLLMGHDVQGLCWQTDVNLEQELLFASTEENGAWRGMRQIAQLHTRHDSASRIVQTIVREAAAFQPDVIIVGNIHGSDLPLTLFLALRTVAPVVAYLHDYYLFTGRCAYPGDCRLYTTGCDATCPTAHELPKRAPEKIQDAWQLLRDTFAGPHGIPMATNSRWLLDKLRSAFQEQPSAEVIHLGLDTNLFRPLERSLARRLLGLPEDRFIILSGAVNVKDQRKGGALLKQLIKALAEDVDFVVIGADSKGIGKAHLSGLVQDLSKMPLLYNAADLFVGTSLEEAFGQTFCEAAACGIPSVAFKVGGIPEIARHDFNARLTEDLSVGGLLKGIRFFMGNPETRTAYGQAGRELVEQEFSLESQAKRWREYLLRLAVPAEQIPEDEKLETPYVKYNLDSSSGQSKAMSPSPYNSLVTVDPRLAPTLRLKPSLETPPWGIEMYEAHDLTEFGYSPDALGKATLLWLGHGESEGLQGTLVASEKQDIEMIVRVRPGPGRKDKQRTVELTLNGSNGETKASQQQFDSPANLVFGVTLQPGANEFGFAVLEKATVRRQPDGEERPLLVLLQHISIRPFVSASVSTALNAPCDPVSEWLQSLPSKDGFHFISKPRRFAHEEGGYDEQYKISPDNTQTGEGLVNLLLKVKADFSCPALEIGCGTGGLSLGLVSEKAFPAVVLTDPSTKFLEITRRKLEQAPTDTTMVRYGVLLAEEINRFPKSSLSLIALCSTLHHVLDVPKFLHDVAEVLRPGGILTFQEPCYEGYVLMGALAQFIPVIIERSGYTLTRHQVKQVQSFVDTMRFYARRDIDKSKAEDKHLFRVDEIMKIGEQVGLSVEFLPNIPYEHYAATDDTAFSQFSFFDHFSYYLRIAMSFDETLLKLIEQHFTPYCQFIEDISRGAAPYMYGIFVCKKQ